MAWIITHDILSPKGGRYEEDNREGQGVDIAKLKATPQAERITARLLDDDLEHYYTISATPDAYIEDEHGSLCHAWEWAMADAGVTHCCIRIETAIELGMPREIAERIAFTKGQHKGWVSLFG